MSKGTTTKEIRLTRQPYLFFVVLFVIRRVTKSYLLPDAIHQFCYRQRKGKRHSFLFRFSLCHAIDYSFDLLFKSIAAIGDSISFFASLVIQIKMVCCIKIWQNFLISY